MNEQEISGATGFDAGDEFTSEQDVRDYFQRDELRSCISPSETQCDDGTWVDPRDELPSQTELDGMAAAVIENQWHCEFSDCADERSRR